MGLLPNLRFSWGWVRRSGKKNIPQIWGSKIVSCHHRIHEKKHTPEKHIQEHWTEESEARSVDFHVNSLTFKSMPSFDGKKTLQTHTLHVILEYLPYMNGWNLWVFHVGTYASPMEHWGKKHFKKVWLSFLVHPCRSRAPKLEKSSTKSTDQRLNHLSEPLFIDLGRVDASLKGVCCTSGCGFGVGFFWRVEPCGHLFNRSYQKGIYCMQWEGWTQKKSRKCSLIPSAPVVFWNGTHIKNQFSLPSSRPHAQLITLLSLSFAPIPNEKSRVGSPREMFCLLETRES